MSLAGRVAIVTGAGGGLGRAHARYLAGQGAQVVVNDVAPDAAEKGAAEIVSAGGQAMAIGGSVTDEADVSALVQRTMQAWGRIDILVNNAGILRDKSFAKMSLDDFRLVVEVHLMGAVIFSKAVWEIMRAQGYGRIVMTTSSSGLYGNFGQANYGAAKASLVGLMKTLAIEGARDNIKVNAICPVAGTRMTENLMPPEMLEAIKPEYVTPAVVFMASEDAPTGIIISAGAGAFSSSQIVESPGVNLGHAASADDVAANWDKISDFTGSKHYTMGGEHSAHFFELMKNKPIVG